MPMHTLRWAPFDARCTEDADTAADERERRMAWEDLSSVAAIHPAEAGLFQQRTLDSGSVNGGTVRTVVCRECGGCRVNDDGNAVVQHHEAMCGTPVKVRALDAERVRRLRRAVLG